MSDNEAPLAPVLVRAATEDEIPASAKRLIKKAASLGWEISTTYARATVEVRHQADRSKESVLVRLRKPRTSTGATALWVDRKFDSANRWAPELGQWTRPIGVRGLTAWLDAVDIGDVEFDVVATIENLTAARYPTKPCAQCHHAYAPHLGPAGCAVMLNMIPTSQGGIECPCRTYVAPQGEEVMTTSASPSDTRECPKDGCTRRLPYDEVLACRFHWFTLSAATRRRVWAAWSGNSHEDYLKVQEAAVAEMNAIP